MKRVHEDIPESVDFKRPTILVLGAGASAPYGFPTGDALKTQILNSLKRGPGRKPHPATSKFDKYLIEKLREAFTYTQHRTIDQFLEHKPSFRELGSYLIAHTILPLEKPDKLFPGSDWYLELFKFLDFHNERRCSFELDIITFNYDRSFEHYMTKAIDYNISDHLVEIAHENRNKIQIVHAHGSFGEYPNIPYGMTDPENSEEFHTATQNIKIVSDDLKDAPTFKQARTLVQKAGNIVFLGFGYNRETLNTLFENIDTTGKYFFGTGYKLQREIRDELYKNLPGIKLGGDNTTCLEFIREIGLGSPITT